VPLQVRIRNFQSIEEATLKIEGLTVITGPNNSGKTAVMRAIRGVFTNPPAGPLVRQGADYLSVTLTLDDGNEVVWEKGWEKPGQKGGAVNRYYLNKKLLESVGRGCPPEVEALGIRSIDAGNDKLWPQIAQQFDGTLFLVNRPGAVLAESLSDVERVGKLTSALRLSEKDKRAATAELKVRRQDLLGLEAEARKWEGLDSVEREVEAITQVRDEALKLQGELDPLVRLRSRFQEAFGSYLTWANFQYTPPSEERGLKIQAALSKVSGLKSRLLSATREASLYESFSVPEFPEAGKILAIQTSLKEATQLRRAIKQGTEEEARFRGFSPPKLPSPQGVRETRSQLSEAHSLRKKLTLAQEEVRIAEKSLQEVREKLAGAESEVVRLLGTRGVCPTCNTVHSGSKHV
jgi:DNA repair exonuclease SbcCD ATPase subunit